ncbi:MAG: CYTH domain-containing protein [Chloroflexi bacterium]|nr:MAG: CYTH domain-containing protein [Chloroflexota bacterium]
MQPVDLLLTGGYVVTMDARRRLIPNGAVAIKDDKIVAVGPAPELETTFQAKTIIDCQDCVISPGLINAHTHVPMTLLRGLADDLRLDVWLYGYMMPVEREFVNNNFCYIGTLLACAEMIRSGVTTFCDMYYNEAEVARATAEAGMRAVLAQTILKFPSPDATNYDESLEYCRRFIEEWLDHPLIVPAVGPHAPYTATPDMLRQCVRLATEYDVPLHIHVAETALEQENSRTQYGMTVVPWLDQYDLFQAKVIAAHCVHLEDGEMHTLHRHNAGVAHCPSSNMKLASGTAPVSKMVNLGLHVGIGTDGPASNNDLDMFEEVRLAAFLQKGVFGDPTLLPARKVWELATIEGARALHIDHLTGSLEPGKKADIAIISTDRTHQLPHFHRDPEAVYSRLVYASKATDVRDVIVNGRVLMRHRNLLTLDEPEILSEAGEIARQIDAFLMAREESILSKLLAISADFIPQETFEIQVKVRLDEPFDLHTRLQEAGLTAYKPSRRDQYDTYFLFKEHDTDRLRFREDEIRDEQGNLLETFYTMTLMGPTSEKEYEHSILLTRARYTATAGHSLRFYREYFKPVEEREVIKHRQRCHVLYKETDFAINLDRMVVPEKDTLYLEIKSRTWSAKDALHKAELIGELLERLGLQTAAPVKNEYVEMVRPGNGK